MEILEVTWLHATKIWWSLLWRGIFYVLLITLPVGFALGVIAAVLNITEQAQPYFQLIGGLIGIPVGIWVIKIVLEKQFSDFQIVLTPSVESMLDEESKNT